MGPVGTQALCTALQQRLNPPAAHKAELKLYDKVLRTGDKVMQVRNDYDIPFTRPGGGEDGAGAFNGDMGVIEAVDPREGTVTVRSEDRRLVYSGEALRELELAYAITIHKSQGSEFAAVVVPLFDVPPRLCYRNLLYTGVTRAKRPVHPCGACCRGRRHGAERHAQQAVFKAGADAEGGKAYDAARISGPCGGRAVSAALPFVRRGAGLLPECPAWQRRAGAAFRAACAGHRLRPACAGRRLRRLLV